MSGGCSRLSRSKSSSCGTKSTNRRSGIVANLDDFVGLLAAGRIKINHIALLAADQRSCQRRRYGQARGLGVRFQVANNLPGGFTRLLVVFGKHHGGAKNNPGAGVQGRNIRSEEHTSELQSRGPLLY